MTFKFHAHYYLYRYILAIDIGVVAIVLLASKCCGSLCCELSGDDGSIDRQCLLEPAGSVGIIVTIRRSYLKEHRQIFKFEVKIPNLLRGI